MVDPLMTNPEGAVILGPTGTMYGAKQNVVWDTSEVRANLKKLQENYPKELGAALREEGLAIMEHSLMLCPYDQDNPHLDGTPHLNETADVAGPYFADNVISIILSYDTPYAVLQHEVQEYHHDKPETWKYLEHPMNARSQFLAANLVRGVDIERAMEGYYAESTLTLQENMGKWGRLKTFQNKQGGQATGRFA